MLFSTRYLVTQKADNVRTMWAVLDGKCQRTLDQEVVRK